MYDGVYHCPICGEPLRFAREDDVVPELRDTYVQVVHDHGDALPVWRLVVYRHRRRQRYPREVAALRLIAAAQRRGRKDEGQVERRKEALDLPPHPGGPVGR